MACSCSTCCAVFGKCLIVILGILVIGCIFGALKGPPAVNQFVAKEIESTIDKLMVFSPTSKLFQNWMYGKVPAYQRFYFFDIQNADDIANGAKPSVVEVGPYTYRVKGKRFNVTFGDNDTMSFEGMTWLEFIPEMSAGLENDTITTVNLPFATTTSQMKYRDWFERLTLSAVATIHGQGMFRTLTIGDLLWGYEDSVLKQLQDLAGKDTIKDTVVGILKGKNGTVNSAVINTGESDPLQLNQIIEMNGSDKLSCWDRDEANIINGSDGTILHPRVNKDEIIHVFNPTNRRTIQFTYEEDLIIYDVPMMRFAVPAYIYANASTHPPNDVFCQQETCMEGIVNISSCMGLLPIGLSMPHYLYAPSDLVDAIEGIEPNETLHQTYFVVEPVTGIGYIQRRRVQLNVYMGYVDGIMQTYDIPSMYYPLLWMETSVDLPERVANEFKKSLSAADGYDDIVFYFFTGTAAFCFVLIAVILLCLCKCCKKNKTDKIKPKGGAYKVVATDEHNYHSNGQITSISNNSGNHEYMEIKDNDTAETNTIKTHNTPNGRHVNNNTYKVLCNGSDVKQVWLKQETNDGECNTDKQRTVHVSIETVL